MAIAIDSEKLGRGVGATGLESGGRGRHRDERQVEDIEVGRSPVEVAFTPNVRFLHATLSGGHKVAKVDVRACQLIGKVAV